jgi:hypothetical protein
MENEEHDQTSLQDRITEVVTLRRSHTFGISFA